MIEVRLWNFYSLHSFKRKGHEVISVINEVSEEATSLFVDALDVEPARRRAFVDRVCGSNERLRAEVERLLAADAAAGDFLSRPAIEDPSSTIPLARTSRTFRPRDLVAGRFRILGFLGEGGMGEVYEAEDLELGEHIALKTILPEIANNPRYGARLLKELQLARKVTHPNVCRVFDVARHIQDGTEIVFLTMELLRGETLSTRLRRSGALSPEEALPLIRQIAQALEAAHQAGVIHRDLKCSNVILTGTESGEQRAVVMDFGLAFSAPSAGETNSLTAKGTVLGTLGYIAPECLEGDVATVRSDIYSMGVMLYEMVTGSRPFPNSLRYLKQTKSPLPRAQAHARGLPGNWERAITRCLEPDPAERFASAKEVVEALAPRRAGIRSTRWYQAVLVAVLAIILAVCSWIGYREISGLTARTSQTGAEELYHQGEKLFARSDRPGNLEKAISLFQQSVQRDPKFAPAEARLARAYFAEYKASKDPTLIKQALDSANRALKDDHDLAAGFVALGAIHSETGETDIATNELHRAVELDRRSPEAHAALGQMYQQLGRSAEAESELKRAVDLGPDDWRWHNQLGRFYETSGQYAAAAQEYKEVIEKTPDNSIGLLNLGVIYEHQERYPESEKFLRKSIANAPTYNGWYLLGNVLFRQSKFPDSIAAFKEALKINDKSYLPWGNLAAAYLWSNNKKAAFDAYGNAIRRAEEDRKNTPDDSFLLTLLSSYYATIGKPAESLPLLKRAIALIPENNPSIIGHIGETYELLGMREQALRWLHEAVQKGYPISRILRSPELADLRKDPRFTEQVMKFAKQH